MPWLHGPSKFPTKNTCNHTWTSFEAARCQLKRQQNSWLVPTGRAKSSKPPGRDPAGRSGVMTAMTRLRNQSVTNGSLRRPTTPVSRPRRKRRARRRGRTRKGRRLRAPEAAVQRTRRQRRKTRAAKKKTRRRRSARPAVLREDDKKEKKGRDDKDKKKNREKEHDDKKKKRSRSPSKASSSKSGKSTPKATTHEVKIRCINAVDAEGNGIVKDTDHVDTVEVASQVENPWSIKERFLKAQGKGEDAKNWQVKLLTEGVLRSVCELSTLAHSCEEVALVRKGG